MTSITSPTGGYGNNGLASATARLAQQAVRKTTTSDPNAATSETAAAGDQVTLSATAMRLLKARQNLTARESDPANLGAAAWQTLMADATVTADRRAAADDEITALEASDPDHALIAKQARAFATDETGLYTNDERDAAEREMNKQQQSWISQQTVAGVTPAFYEVAKQQYAQLSPLEKSRYPTDYLAQCDATAAKLEHQGSTDPYWWMDGSSPAPEDASPIPQLQQDAGSGQAA